MKLWNRTKTSETQAVENESTGLLKRFKQAVSTTRRNIISRVEDIAKSRRSIDPETLEQIEEALIASDMGPRTALEIIEHSRRAVDRKALADFDQLKEFIKSQLLGFLNEPMINRRESPSLPNVKPLVMLIVGVNGTGKTTTIGKLAHKYRQQGLSVLLCGGDTFRAAASDQLAIWADRAGVPLIQQQPGADPAAVVFDSLKAAQARGTDLVIVDTAGRLHTKLDLMQELQKIGRIAAREVVGAPHEVLLVLDAVTGQNGLEQARQFLQAVNVTGLVLTKLDGTAKGGIVVAIARELKVPIRFVGLGEGLEDLVEFSPELYVDSLFEE